MNANESNPPPDLQFTRINDQTYRCAGARGAYMLRGEPTPDEFDSAMRCGIPEGNPFVQQIPLVWSCDCSAGQHGKSCRHVRGLLRDVFGQDRPGEAEVAAAAKRAASDRREQVSAAKRAEVDRLARVEALRAEENAIQLGDITVNDRGQFVPRYESEAMVNLLRKLVCSANELTEVWSGESAAEERWNALSQRPVSTWRPLCIRAAALRACDYQDGDK